MSSETDGLPTPAASPAAASPEAASPTPPVASLPEPNTAADGSPLPVQTGLRRSRRRKKKAKYEDGTLMAELARISAGPQRVWVIAGACAAVASMIMCGIGGFRLSGNRTTPVRGNQSGPSEPNPPAQRPDRNEPGFLTFNWRTHTVRGSYEVDMPGEVIDAIKPRPGDADEECFVESALADFGDDVRFLVVRDCLSKKDEQRSQDDFFAHEKNSRRENLLTAEVLNEEVITVAGRPVLQVSVKTRSGQAVYWRVFRVPERHEKYVLETAGNSAQIYQAATRRFFDSFRLK